MIYIDKIEKIFYAQSLPSTIHLIGDLMCVCLSPSGPPLMPAIARAATYVQVDRTVPCISYAICLCVALGSLEMVSWYMCLCKLEVARESQPMR